ncbi:MAG TPA: hypothetical protein VGN54_07015 [Mycobacteriales bacterium]|jgi:DnaK suppressor protein|nr:hypothetical protein [Mycobacteriales bacterium]
MDEEQARARLRTDRAEVERQLADMTDAGRKDRAAEQPVGDSSDGAQSLTAEAVDDAITADLQDRLAALDRAEERLANKSYGRSIRSGLPIPAERLEADPAAELTVEEAETQP